MFVLLQYDKNVLHGYCIRRKLREFILLASLIEKKETGVARSELGK